MKRIALALILLASPALAQNAPQTQQPKKQKAAPALVIECKGPFGRNASHADLVKAFGARNVTWEDVNRPEGEVVKATVLFAKDKKRRVEIEWFDPKRRRKPISITVFGEDNLWTGPLGVKNGMSIEEIEKRAGKPFEINGFGFDVAGAGHFGETALGDLPGGCYFGGHFEIEGGLPPEHLKHFIGEGQIASNDKDLLTLKPKLWIWTLSYMPEGF